MCYYLDRTSDLRQNKELFFTSSRKDIYLATVSSWIKQTVSYVMSSLIRRPSPFVRLKPTMSKATQSGVSFKQVLTVCHWKSHTTFTQFYLKDVVGMIRALSSGLCGGCLAKTPLAQICICSLSHLSQLGFQGYKACSLATR